MRARLVAFYLPQFHPIPENDRWWGKGFTEWDHVRKARPLFPGHDQPRIPGELGYYDLREPEIRQKQADLATGAGIEAFCYWHYWFDGKRLLERPFTEVVESGRPRLKFCLAWANQSWSGIWYGLPDRVLIRQSYSGLKDYESHFHALEEAFGDNRYLTVDGKKVFLVYDPGSLPDPLQFTDSWRSLAAKAGLKGFYFIGFRRNESWSAVKNGFDSAVVPFPKRLSSPLPEIGFGHFITRIGGPKLRRALPFPAIHSYRTLVESPPSGGYLNGTGSHPFIVSNWDNTPRCGPRGGVFQDATPSLFRCYLRRVLSAVAWKPCEERLVFIKSWNEWGEGNYLEPDQRFGRGYLDVLAQEVVGCY